VYRTIEGLSTTATQRANATVVQVLSLTQRSRLTDAIGLGLNSLRELGIAVPDDDELPIELDTVSSRHLYRWLDHTEAADELARPDITETHTARRIPPDRRGVAADVLSRRPRHPRLA